MSLDKAIEHGKAKRKPYRGAKAIEIAARDLHRSIVKEQDDYIMYKCPYNGIFEERGADD